MIKKLTLRLDERMMALLEDQTKKNGFTSYNEYFRHLLLRELPAPQTGKNEPITMRDDLAALEERLQRLEETLDALRLQSEVNGKALLVLLSFSNLEAIPAKGLQNARSFLARKELEIKARR